LELLLPLPREGIVKKIKERLTTQEVYIEGEGFPSLRHPQGKRKENTMCDAFESIAQEIPNCNIEKTFHIAWKNTGNEVPKSQDNNTVKIRPDISALMCSEQECSEWEEILKSETGKRTVRKGRTQSTISYYVASSALC